MKSKRIFYYFSLVIGIVVTLFMLMAFGPKFIGQLSEIGVVYLLEIPKAFANWYDDPTAFFLTYFIGYILIWWRPLRGALLIIIGGILFFAFNSHNIGVFIFIIPTLLVALSYILYWNADQKE